ncbi:uncharacterized protein BDV17DRAFT_28163 [Aspergillus undulatus]|uniref:uncharacterized protein n=1 Tax=Aspergillus undulatus TaxID=1810928 RepID=UPI003CCDE57D
MSSTTSPATDFCPIPAATPCTIPATDLCSIPAAQPPPGQTSNLDDPDSLAAVTVAVTTVVITWATLFVAARIYTNFRKLTLADCFVVTSLILSGGYNGLVLAILEYARHQWDVPVCWYNARYFKILYVQAILLSPAMFFAKSSIFLLYQQIFTAEKRMKYAILLGLLSTFIIYWPYIALLSIYCAPHAGQSWTDLTSNGMPQRMLPWSIAQGALSVILDLYIFILPLPRLWKIQQPMWKRLQIMAVFSTAFMGVIASVGALIFRIRLKTTSDGTYAQGENFICTNVENSVAIIVSSMPAAAKFIRGTVLEWTFIKRLSFKSSSSSGNFSSEGFPSLTRGRRIPRMRNLEEANGLGSLNRAGRTISQQRILDQKSSRSPSIV